MKLETIISASKEIYIELEGGSTITVNPWANCEGASIIMMDKNGGVRLASVMRWEEIDGLTLALAAARL